MFPSVASTFPCHQRPDLPLPFKISVAGGGEEVCGAVPLLPAPFDLSVGKPVASFDSFDHAIDQDCVEHNPPFGPRLYVEAIRKAVSETANPAR
jgi:hypothetical protein